MRRALLLAERGWGQTAPNPMVGAVVVREGAIVGEGWHTAYGAPHAEVEALRGAGSLAAGATLYVTLEPCNHQGKTPPCTQAILAAGVGRVVAAVADPNPIARGGAAFLRTMGVDVEIGIEEAAGAELNAAFTHATTSDRAFVILKLALSLDAAIADHTRRAAWLTSDESRKEVHRWRAGTSATAVGIGTVLADDPMLTVRDHAPAPRVTPARVIFDRGARLPLTSRLVETARDLSTIVVAQSPPQSRVASLRDAGVTVLDAASLREALDMLAAAGIHSLLVEGGAGLAGALINDELVDRLIIFRAPLLLGAGSLSAFGSVRGTEALAARRWSMISARRLGDDDMTIYAPLR